MGTSMDLHQRDPLSSFIATKNIETINGSVFLIGLVEFMLHLPLVEVEQVELLQLVGLQCSSLVKKAMSKQPKKSLQPPERLRKLCRKYLASKLLEFQMFL